MSQKFLLCDIFRRAEYSESQNFESRVKWLNHSEILFRRPSEPRRSRLSPPDTDNLLRREGTG